MKDGPPCPGERADGHNQRVDEHVALGDAVVLRALDNLLSHRKAHVGVLGDACLVVGDADDGGAVLLDEGQDGLQPLLFTGDRIEQRLALVDLQAALQGGDDGGINGERHVGDGLDELHSRRHDGRLVGEGDAGVNVEHVGAGLHLGYGVRDDAVVVAGGHLAGEGFAAGRVDALADNGEGAVGADNDGLGAGADFGVHGVYSFLAVIW